VRFYGSVIASIVLLVVGCSSSHKTENREKNITKKTEQKVSTKLRDGTQNSKFIARLVDDNNQTMIQVAPKSIDTNICSDKVIILNVFATWSKVSIGELEVLDKIKHQNKDVCVVSIAIDSDDKTSLPNSYQVSHKVIFGIQNNKFVDKVASIIHIDKNFKLPMNIIYKNNKYIDNYQGLMPFEMLNYIIKEKQ